MEFKKYNSIENSYQQRFVEKCFYNLGWYNDFIVQEKIHWANFGFYVYENEIKCAKRTGFILEDEKFFNYKKVLNDNKERLENLRKEIWKDIIVFWEIFWWSVKEEVFYYDEQLFYAFDIISNWEYLSVDECNKYFEKHWFLYAKTLFRWNLEDCFTYDIKQNSILEKEITWSEFLIDWNIMEWIVIKPNENKMIWESRIIFKKKTDKFSEKKAPDKIQFDTSWFWEYEIYITKPRLDNIISKYWEITDKKDIAKYTWYFMQDIIEDAEKDWLELSKQAKRYLFNKSVKFLLENLF